MTNGTIYDYSTKSLEGKDVALRDYSGKVMLIVNTASQCGFTPQYAELETLHQKFGPNGLVVIGFPCNQFGGQEPGGSEEIATFCQRNYGVSFPMMHKVEVNGDNTDPIYKYLKDAAPGVLGSEGIKWNFTKFLVGKDGKVVKRYAPTVKPLDIQGDIEEELAK